MNYTGKTPRRHIRTEVGVDITATISTSERTGDCTLENISSGGAQIITRVPLSRGQVVTLDIGKIGSVEGKVAWVNRRTFGLRFSTEMDDISDLLLAVAIY